MSKQHGLWATVLVNLDGIIAIKHVRIPILVVRVTPEQAYLGLGA